MEILIIICLTVVAIIAIAGALSTIEKCSYYKHYYKCLSENPEALEKDYKGVK